jgi:putative membrane protein
MNPIRSTVVLTACGLCWVAAAAAQAPATTSGSTAEPSSATTPHQQGALRNAPSSQETAPAADNGSASDPSAASSPHQRDVTGSSAHTSGEKMSARSFVTRAAEDGMTEVKLAELASQKSQNDAIKQFASHMQSDHSTANSELESLAKQQNIPVPDKLDAKHQAQVDALSKKSGAAFDKAYAAEMVKAHKQAVSLFKAGSHSSDQSIASFASKTLPTLESHERMADDLASQLRVASAGGSNSAKR